jgi:outer membrane protein OmpA-like peptidoglycan-associated protein
MPATSSFRFPVPGCRLFAVLLFAPFYLLSQNLIPDSSFTHYRGCPSEFNQFYLLQHWYRPTEGTPDVFSNCNVKATTPPEDKKKKKEINPESSQIAEVPVNDIGFQYPHTGDSYAGLAAYASINKEYAEYMCVRLIEPLKRNTVYRLRMYISLADKSFYYGSNLHASFLTDRSTLPTKRPMLGYNTESIKGTPSLKFDLSMFKDTVNWLMIQADYEAFGDENFLVIGAFNVPSCKGKFPAKDKATGVITDRKPYTYYYIDDVSVIKVQDPSMAVIAGSIDGSEDKPFIIPNLYFDTDKWDILPTSYASLDSVATYLKTLVGYRIEVGGHTDDVGTDEHNMKLSENRAKAVADYLISKGVHHSILSSWGYGETSPISTNKDMNRRVEIKLVRQRH